VTGRRPAARKQGDAGFTLVEMMVVIMLLSVVGSIVMGVLVSSMRQAAKQDDRTRTLNEAKVAMERVTREIRGANEIKLNDEKKLQFELRFEDARGYVVRSTTLEVVPVGDDTWLRQTDVDRIPATGVTEPPRVRKVLGGLEIGRSQAFFCYAAGDGLPVPTGTATVPLTSDPDLNNCVYDREPAEWRQPTASETRTVEVKIRIKQQGDDKAARLNQLVSVRNLED
jgi:prepilin-type N-terminal cleavage/methylation domain-containing protein